METPAVYRIRVQGRLDETWSDRLAGMGIMNSWSSRDKKPLTLLVGSLCEQAELVGVLNSLYELHLPILTVEILKGEDEDEDEGEEVLEKYDLQKEEDER